MIANDSRCKGVITAMLWILFAQAVIWSPQYTTAVQARWQSQAAYDDCIRAKLAGFGPQNEPADTMAKAAMDACSDKRDVFRQRTYAAEQIRGGADYSQRAEEWVSTFDAALLREYTSIVIQVRGEMGKP